MPPENSGLLGQKRSRGSDKKREYRKGGETSVERMGVPPENSGLLVVVPVQNLTSAFRISRLLFFITLDIGLRRPSRLELSNTKSVSRKRCEV